MPLKIIATPDDPYHSRRVVYVPDRATRRDPPRPKGSMTFENGWPRRVERVRPERALFVGLDLGQSNDWTALVVVERTPDGLQVPHLSRTRGRPYPEVVGGVAAFMDHPEVAGARLVIDATGVGRPVRDLLRGAGLVPTAVTITGGTRVTGGGRRVSVPKRDLVNAVLLAMQAGTLSIAADIVHAAELRAELADMRAKISAAGNDRYEARDGVHDDLVLALALAVWAAERAR